ncbi:MAG: Holliday junction resolvase RuvX [Clostridiales bacterium]|nr:Holliday junction resolvase RuvX [Clostridiales bacterium]
MKLLCVDYGDVRSGIAVSDQSGFLASPVCVIRERDQARLVEQIAQLAREQQSGKLVVGLPVNMDGSEGFRARACREFAAALEAASGLETVLADERLTTVSAHRAMLQAEMKRKKRKDMLDAMSAVMILQSYLDRKE